jgi:hypothetical protein
MQKKFAYAYVLLATLLIAGSIVQAQTLRGTPQPVTGTSIGIPATSPDPIPTSFTIQGTDPYLELKKTPMDQSWRIRAGGGGQFNAGLDFYDVNGNRSALTIGKNGNMSLGTTTVYTNSRVFVYGGPTGANIDVRGDSAIVGGDQATIELEGDDYDTLPNSALLQYYGSKALGTTMGFPNKRLGVVSFSNANVGIIRTAGGSPSPLVLGTDDRERMRIDGNGNIGIGTSNPQSKLHVSAGANATTTISLGELNVATSKTCVNMNRSSGAPASFFINDAGAMVVENSYCK